MNINVKKLLVTGLALATLSGCTGGAASTPTPSGSGEASGSATPSASATPTGPTSTLTATAKGPADIVIKTGDGGAETIRILGGTWSRVIERPASDVVVTLDVTPVDQKKAIKLTCKIKQGKKVISKDSAKAAGTGVSCGINN